MTTDIKPGSDTAPLFTPLKLRNTAIRNRIFRSATYEGMGDPRGFPRAELAHIYADLARGGVGAIITGFVYIAQAGRAMQPGQCGIDTDEKAEAWQSIVRRVKREAPDISLFMQLAHAGRQTRRAATGLPVAGVSARQCSYFQQKVAVLDEREIKSVIREFGKAAYRAQQAGFDGVQIHAAHGYLVHQFLSPWTNTRNDAWADRALFLEEIIRAVKTTCGHGFPVLVKLSAADDNSPGIRIADTIGTVRRIERQGVDAVEISYGTMEYALNIIRGDCPIDLVLKVNPLFNNIPSVLQKMWKLLRAKSYVARFMPFEENYNVAAAARIGAETSLPVIAVGGIRTRKSMINCVSKHGLAGVALCRPLICEPDLPVKLRQGDCEQSECANCNLCTIYCDSFQPVRCYRRRKERG